MAVAIPDRPVSGETVLTEWGKQIIDYTAERMRFIRNPQAGTWQVDNDPAVSGRAYLELTQLPPNDPNIVYAHVQAMVRGATDNDNMAITLLDYHSDIAAAQDRLLKYNTGQGSRGGMSGGIPIAVGGVNHRQIVWTTSGDQNWLRVLGWWVKEEPDWVPRPPYPVEGDPIVAGWGKSLTDYAGGMWEYHPIPLTYTIRDFTGSSTINKVNVLGIPVGDPDVVAVSIHLMIRDMDGADNGAVSVYDGKPDGTQGAFAGSSYTEGVSGRGGNASPLIVLTGGATNDEIWWTGGDASMDIWIAALGYWTRAKPGAASLPVPPAPGAPISSAWANGVIDCAAKKVRFVPIDNTQIIGGVDGQTVTQVVELTNLPANAANLRYAEVFGMIRDNSGGGSHVLNLLHFPDDALAGLCYSSGTQQRGGGNGPFMVRVGGVNNRQIKWNTNEAGAGEDVWIYCSGYYVEDMD